MTSYSAVRIDIQANGCALIFLNRPDVRNALNSLLINELTNAIEECEQNPLVRVIILKGEGKIFCAGADLASMQEIARYTHEENIKDALQLGRLFETLNNCSKPTIAFVQGGAYGGGVGLVAACDIAIATPDAKFALTEVRLGLVPAVISPYIIKAMGPRQARHYALTARTLSADQALRCNLIHSIVASDQIESTLSLLIADILKGSPAAQTATKKLFREVQSLPPSTDVGQVTARIIADARASAEGQEGLKAFLEKRQPNWAGSYEKN